MPQPEDRHLHGAHDAAGAAVFLVQRHFELQQRRPNPFEHEYRVRQRAARSGHAVQESNAQPSAHGLFMNTEFFAQDNWRVERKFTVDAGVRF